MRPLKIFVCGYTEQQIDGVPPCPHLVPVNLSDMPIGSHQRNSLAESRLLLSDMHTYHPAEYMGIATWRWHDKCRHMMPLADLCRLPLSPRTVYAAWPAHDWVKLSELDHHGIAKYLDEMFTLLPAYQAGGMGLYANQFICHHSVYDDFIRFFRQIFAYLDTKYGDKYDYYVKSVDQPRSPAVLYERIACLYFSQRTDLKIVQIPHKLRNRELKQLKQHI